MQEFIVNVISILTNPFHLSLLIGANMLGIMIGALPGLTATMGIALLAGLTYTLPTNIALIVIMGLYVGAIYGGSITAILLNIPGTGSAAATALDGYPLAKKGKAGYAIILTRIASFLGTGIGLLMLMTIAPLLLIVAMEFSSVEIALLAFFGVLISGFVASGDMAIKGWIAGFLGMIISTIGIDPLHGYTRFTFGMSKLAIGISFVPAMIGVFGMPQILNNLASEIKGKMIDTTDKSVPSLSEIFSFTPNIIRSGLLGAGVGIIPGVGEDIGSWVSYFAAQGMSKEKDKFGKGSYEGIVAAEVGNNSAIGGALIPLLTLGIPGSPPAAVLLGALMLHGIRPGPMIAQEHPGFIMEMGGMVFIAAFALLINGFVVAKIFIKGLEISPKILMPLVAVFSVVGSYAIDLRIFDVYVFLIIGLLFYFLANLKFPVAPFVLGVILGPMIDENFRRTLWAYDNLVIPFTRPIALLLIIAIGIMVLFQIEGIKNYFISKFSFLRE